MGTERIRVGDRDVVVEKPRPGELQTGLILPDAGPDSLAKLAARELNAMRERTRQQQEELARSLTQPRPGRAARRRAMRARGNGGNGNGRNRSTG